MSQRRRTMRPMSGHFNPWGIDRPCWHCHHYVAMLPCGAAECSLQLGPRVRSQPERGCSAFEREPGADDEPGAPAPEGRDLLRHTGQGVMRLRTGRVSA